MSIFWERLVSEWQALVPGGSDGDVPPGGCALLITVAFWLANAVLLALTLYVLVFDGIPGATHNVEKVIGGGEPLTWTIGPEHHGLGGGCIGVQRGANDPHLAILLDEPGDRDGYVVLARLPCPFGEWHADKTPHWRIPGRARPGESYALVVIEAPHHVCDEDRCPSEPILGSPARTLSAPFPVDSEYLEGD